MKHTLQSADAETEPSDLEDHVGYNLKRAYLIIQGGFRAALGEDGLSPRSYSALSLVVQYPNISQSEVARTLGIERSGLVAIVDDLEKRGYLIRSTVPGDRRVHALVPTKDGMHAYATASTAVRNREKRLMSHLSEQEQQTLVDLLKKIRAREE